MGTQYFRTPANLTHLFSILLMQGKAAQIFREKINPSCNLLHDYACRMEFIRSSLSFLGGFSSNYADFFFLILLSNVLCLILKHFHLQITSKGYYREHYKRG